MEFYIGYKVQYIAVTFHNDEVPVYQLKDLFKMYIEHLKQLGATDEIVENTHRTRFKEKLLCSIPGLTESHQSYKSVVISLNKEIGKALFQACQYPTSI